MRPDGNCRSCMVEIKGERVLAPSCCRTPAPGMEVHERQRARRACAEDDRRAARVRHAGARLQARLRARAVEGEARHRQAALRARARSPRPTCRIRRWRSTSTPASSARAACARAARSRSTTSSATRSAARIRASCSTCDDPMGDSTCVACGECVQACPTGALAPANDAYLVPIDKQGRRRCARTAASAARSPTTSTTTRSCASRAATGPPITSGCASRAASASTTSRTRSG